MLQIKSPQLTTSAKLVFLFLHICYINQAKASLGGSLDSIESDRKAFDGKLSEVILPQARESTKDFTEHLIRRDGADIREYALPDGTVFAVSWRGPVQPDLSVLLGSYFQEYQDSLASIQRSTGRTAQRRGRSARVIRSKNMVIERSGHMRDIRGKAYLPQLMPAGVQPGDLHG